MHFYLQCVRVPVPPLSTLPILEVAGLLLFLMYFSCSDECIVVSHLVSICIFLRTKLFICLLVICVQSTVKCLFKCLVHVFQISIFSYWFAGVLCIFWIWILHQFWAPKISSPTSWLSFSSLIDSFDKGNFLIIYN